MKAFFQRPTKREHNTADETKRSETSAAGNSDALVRAMEERVGKRRWNVRKHAGDEGETKQEQQKRSVTKPV